MQQLTTSIYDFEKLINRGCRYVDKTMYVEQLLSSGDTQFFLSRPRRFGKSLLVSTLKAIFLNRREISLSFSLWLAQSLCELPPLELNSTRDQLADAVLAGDLDRVHELLRIFFENIPYDIQLSNEKYYQSIFFVIFKLLGVMVEAEVRTARGRIEAVAITDDNVFIFEFKLHDTAEVAMAQIYEKKYYEKYQNSGKKIVLIGAAFDQTTRNLDHWLVEELDA